MTRPGPRPSSWWLVLFAALAVAAFLAPLASTNPDGLNRVAQDHGFAARERTALRTPFARYTIPGLGRSPAGTALAGLAGTLLTLGAGYGLAAVLSRRPPGGRSSR